MVSGPDEAKWGQRRDPQAGAWALQAPISWPPSSLGPHASRTFDLLISSPSSGFIRELPQLMSSPGGRAHTPSRWVSSKGYRDIWGHGVCPRGSVASLATSPATGSLLQ